MPAAGVKQYDASGSDAWEAGGGGLAKQPRSTNTEDGDGVTVFRMRAVPIRATQERVQYQRAAPPGQLLH